jgi:hypothetical protein
MCMSMRAWNALFNLCLLLTTYWISLDRPPACQLFIMASRIDSSFILFLQLVKGGIHTMMNQDQRGRSTNTPSIKKHYDEWNLNRHLNGYVSFIKKKESSRRHIVISSYYYHTHLNINLVRLHLLSICAMLINVDSSYVYFRD